MASFFGTNGADTLIGTDSADTIEGGDGNDFIDGRGGADLMRGGRGDDLYHVDDAGDVVEELAGQGVDEVRSSISFVLGSDVEHLTLVGTAAIDGTGNSLDNRITGNEAANVIRGGGGTDTFAGGGGDDIYYVEATATVSKRGGISFSGLDLVIEEGDGGVDTIYSNASLALPAEVENIILTGTLELSAFGNALDNVIVGNSARNFLQGRDGDDHIDGGAGADEMYGGAGNDTFVVDHVSDIVQESFDGGTDRVVSFISYQLFNSELENLTLQGGDAIDGTGNFRDNEIVGNGAANILKGEAGNDVLDGGEGVDTLVGGSGDDRYFVDDVRDQAIENSGGGFDTVLTTVQYILGDDVERLEVADAASTYAINLYGNALANQLIGNDGANLLNGRGGADFMSGFGGDDFYIIDSSEDVILEGLLGGFDTVFTTVDYELSDDIERVGVDGFTTTFAIDLTGNVRDNEMWGNDGANVLKGQGGNDILHGLGGADTFAFTSSIFHGIDQIVDFEAGVDKIALDDGEFAGLAAGALAAGAFVTGTAAQDEDDRIIYDPATGALYFDADGSGAGAQVQFSTLGNNLSLSASDFTVI